MLDLFRMPGLSIVVLAPQHHRALLCGNLAQLCIRLRSLDKSLDRLLLVRASLTVFRRTVASGCTVAASGDQPLPPRVRDLLRAQVRMILKLCSCSGKLARSDLFAARFIEMNVLFRNGVRAWLLPL